MDKRINRERDILIFAAALEIGSYAKAGKEFGLTGGRIKQIVRREVRGYFYRAVGKSYRENPLYGFEVFISINDILLNKERYLADINNPDMDKLIPFYAKVTNEQTALAYITLCQGVNIHEITEDDARDHAVELMYLNSLYSR